MIIFGTKGITTTPEKGEFNCPSCISTQNYGLKRVRKFFTLYFIPLIPLNILGEYVECGNCKDTYKTNILDYDPAANADKLEAEYNQAIKKVMIHVLLADGVIDDNEVEVMLDIYSKITGKQIDKEALVEEITIIERNKEKLSNTLINLQGCLNDEGKELVVKAAFYVALADGEFQDEEKLLISNIGRDLGMTSAHLQGVISSI